MVLPHGDGDFYHKYRPRRFSEISGHKQIINSIKKAVTSPSPSQSYLLIGDSGTGKTTTARIMALSLNCDSPSKDGEPCLECDSCQTITSGRCSDIIEVNAADNRGIGDIRALCQTMPLMPMQLRRKVLILDEAHQLTGDAQSSLLKELEEAPKHVFVVLCSTHPQKILPTVKNRCQKFKFSSLKRSEMVSLLEEVAAFEAQDFPKKVYEQIADASEGSPRAALVLLQQVVQMGSTNPSDIARLLEGEEGDDPNVIKICFELNKQRATWTGLVSLYEECKSIGAPAIGMIIAGFYRNQLLKAKNAAVADRFASILELFVIPFAEGKLGENQLVLNLYRAYQITSGGKNATPRYGRNLNRP